MNTEYRNKQHRDSGFDWGTAGAGIGMGLINNISNLAFGNLAQKQQLRGQKQALAQQNEAAMDIWNRTNYGAQVKQLKGAGLNPGLIYGMGGAGGQLGGSSAMPQSSGTGGGMDIMGAAQLKLLNAQAEKLKAETKNLGSSSNLQDVNAQAQVLENILRDQKIQVGANETKRLLDNNDLLTQTFQAELQSRKGIAGTIYEMYLNGGLKAKSEAEIAKAIQDAAKTDDERKLLQEQLKLVHENINGAQLNNALLKLDKELQEKYGVGKDSPWYFKMAGRLLSLIMGK